MNNAGIAPVCRFEDCHDAVKLAPSMVPLVNLSFRPNLLQNSYSNHFLHHLPLAISPVDC